MKNENMLIECAHFIRNLIIRKNIMHILTTNEVKEYKL